MTIYSVPIPYQNIWDYGYGIFVLASFFSPVLLAIILFSAPIKAVMTTFSLKLLKKRLLTYNVPSLEKNHRMVLLAIAISLAILIAVIPHLGREDIKAAGE